MNCPEIKQCIRKPVCRHWDQAEYCALLHIHRELMEINKNEENLNKSEPLMRKKNENEVLQKEKL